jgi:hypothetical protein
MFAVFSRFAIYANVVSRTAERVCRNTSIRLPTRRDFIVSRSNTRASSVRVRSRELLFDTRTS